MKHVYLIKLKKADIYKIGVASNIERRVRAIETHCPFDIEIVYSQLCSHPYGVEKALHNLYVNKRLRREWYRLCKADVDKVIEILRDDTVIGQTDSLPMMSHTEYKAFRRIALRSLGV